MSGKSESTDVIRGANDLIGRGLLGAASDLLAEGLEDHPDDAHLLRALARLRMLERRPAEAVPLLKRALQILQANRSDGTPPENAESPQEEESEFRGESNSLSLLLLPVPDVHSVGAFTSLPESDSDYVAAIEQEVVRRRDYEFDVDAHPQIDHSLQCDQSGAVPTSVEHAPLDETKTSLSDSSSGLTERETVALRVFRARPYPIHETLAFETQAQVRHDETEDSLTLEDFYIDEGESEEDGAAQEVLLDDVEDEISLSDEVFRDELKLDTEKRGYEPLLDDFGDGPADELPTREEMRQIPSRLTREDRARQVAFVLAIEFDWDRAGVELLTSLFVKHWWGSARVALQREIQAGATLKDISLADALREIWRSYPEFSNHFDYRGQVSQRYTVLPWPTAIALVRAFQGYPDEAELESFLVDAYEMWWNDEDMTKRFDSLYNFIRYRMSQYYENNGLSVWNVFRYESNDLDAREHLNRVQKLESLGVPVPDWQSDNLPEVDLHRSAATRKMQDIIVDATTYLRTMEDGDDIEADEEDDL